MAQRLGWAGEVGITLEEAGQSLKVTRERVRQIQKKLITRLERTIPPDIGVIGQVADILANADDPSRSPGSILKRAGLARSVLPTEGIRLLLDLSGLSDVAQIDSVLLERDQWHRDTATVIREAKRLAGAVGVVSADWLTRSIPETDDPVDAVRRTIQSTGWATFLDDTWFWSPRIPRGRNRTINIMRKMLAACGPLTARDVVAGLERQIRLGRLPRLPSEHAVRLLAAAHPGFAIDANGLIASVEPLDPIEELDNTEEVLYLILTGAEDGFLDRQEFQEQAVARGINVNTFSVYTSYSPIVASIANDRWALRGARISPGALAAHGRTIRQRRYVATEWMPDGSLRVDRELTTTVSPVLSIPAALVRFVAGRTFEAVDEKGVAFGSVRFNENGGSWGYGRFIEAALLKPGDLIRLDLNLATGRVQLSSPPRR